VAPLFFPESAFEAPYREPTMLQSIRDKSGSKIAYFILSLLMAAFMFFGIQGYFVASGDTGVAKVGRTEISSSDYRQRMNEHAAAHARDDGRVIPVRVLQHAAVQAPGCRSAGR
jgi:hypothetical protein